MMLVGTGLVFILALIGIMNYINTSISSVQNRLVELSVLESIGMTDRQMKWMLLLEGLLYAAGSLLITMTAGLAVTYGIFQSMNYRGAPFAVPVLPLVCGNCSRISDLYDSTFYCMEENDETTFPDRKDSGI